MDPKHDGVMVRASASELMKPSLIPQSNRIKDFKNVIYKMPYPALTTKDIVWRKKSVNLHVVLFGKALNGMPTLLDRQVVRSGSLWVEMIHFNS